MGENARDESHGYFNLVKIQLEECLAGISKNSISKIIIAYEPIWAISSTANRRDATSEDSREMIILFAKYFQTGLVRKRPVCRLFMAVPLMKRMRLIF
ncbi:MAG: triose-phosphate isomerase [Thermodesulfobacteriota bacterium]